MYWGKTRRRNSWHTSGYGGHWADSMKEERPWRSQGSCNKGGGVVTTLPEKNPVSAWLLHWSSIALPQVIPLPAPYWHFLTRQVFQRPFDLREDKRCHPVRATAGGKLVDCKFKQKQIWQSKICWGKGKHGIKIQELDLRSWRWRTRLKKQEVQLYLICSPLTDD